MDWGKTYELYPPIFNNPVKDVYHDEKSFCCYCYSCCMLCLRRRGINRRKKTVSNNESNSNEQIGGDASTAKADSAPVAAVAPAKDGKALIEGSDCRTCHKDAEKLIGPSYAEVAKNTRPMMPTSKCLQKNHQRRTGCVGRNTNGSPC
ncbi:MAG: hypothetical protein HC846_10660 [Blastocatellia bacterium]|nr:hypothetical protein [Blastocatellia bacterium]